MQQEMDSIEHNCTWKLVDLPAGHHPITLKWVCKLKKNGAGRWLSTRRDLSRAALSRKRGLTTATRSCPWLASSASAFSSHSLPRRGGSVHHMYVKYAFLNGDLKEEVYMRQLLGFVVFRQEGKVLRLRKA
jgi:hypothetical protein